MTLQNIKTKIKSYITFSNKTTSKITKKKKKKKKKKHSEKGKKSKFNLSLSIIFFTSVLLIISSYAWFSASLDVKVKFFDMVVSSDSGLFISLDGIDFSSAVEISKDSLINDLKPTYPNHTNQWASGGLYPVSSNGFKNSNSDKFDIYAGAAIVYYNRGVVSRKFLNTRLMRIDEPSASNIYIAFDFFLKNVSGSPNNDNLYFDEGTSVYIDDDISDDSDGTINSMRFGVIKIGSVSSKSDINTIQNIKCNNNCEMVIYEPHSTLHSEGSIFRAKENGITLIDGVYAPTYAVINEGNNLEFTNGHEGSGFALDTNHFALQKTITDFEKPIFEIPNGITKLRAYVWLEGQDIDSLDTTSEGMAIYVAINFIKDLVGYE